MDASPKQNPQSGIICIWFNFERLIAVLKMHLKLQQASESRFISCACVSSAVVHKLGLRFLTKKQLFSAIEPAMMSVLAAYNVEEDLRFTAPVSDRHHSRLIVLQPLIEMSDDSRVGSEQVREVGDEAEVGLRGREI